jgi:hypothetical protein
MTPKVDYKDEDIVKTECRFAVHVQAREGINPDTHYVKEVLTLKDGRKVPRITLIEDYLRPIWVTKPAFRNHKERKEFEDVDKLDLIMTTESNLCKAVAAKLNVPHLARRRRDLMDIPYIYGGDITSTSLIKAKALAANKFVQSPYSVAVMDIETGIIDYNNGKILMITVTMAGKVYTGCLKSFVEKTGDYDSRVTKAMQTYLPQYDTWDCEFEVFDSELDMLKKAFLVANDWAPDFLAFWNINFDVSEILACLDRNGVDPIDVMADMSIPRSRRYCYYKQGLTKKVTASGRVKPVNPALQWHTMFLTARFYMIDAMSVYKQKRMSKQEEPSYSLDAILALELKTSKLKFKEADMFKKKAWHAFMQHNYPIQYIIYNRYDCISILDLDKKTRDMALDLPSAAGITDFSRYSSNPKKIADALFMFAGKKKRIIGTVGKKVEKKEEPQVSAEDDDDDDDEEEDVSDYGVLSLKDWIITLQSHLLLPEGLKIFSDFPNLVTNLRGLVMDVDVTSSYPSCTQVGNVSKETTLCEIISVAGKEEGLFREQNLGLICGSVNALEYCNKMLELPDPAEMLSLVKAELKKEKELAEMYA